MIFDNKTNIQTVESNPKYKIIDSHLHFLDFTQNSDGFPELTRAMDMSGVSEAIIFGMPLVKKWHSDMRKPPLYYLSDDSRCYYYSGTDHILARELMCQPEEIQRRFHPFCCGVDCTDKYAADQLERLLDLYPDFWQGIGEIMSRHDDLTALSYGEGLRVNNPAFLRIFDLAADRGLPVLVHHNISPQNASEPEYKYELEEALSYNRNCNIIWAHIGISRRIELEELLIIAGELLHNHPNLYVDISWVFFENYVKGDLMNKMEHLSSPSNIFSEMWSILIEKYPDRFMIGTDKVGHWNSYPIEVTKYYSLLDQLSPETAEKVCRGNALRLIKTY